MTSTALSTNLAAKYGIATINAEAARAAVFADSGGFSAWLKLKDGDQPVIVRFIPQLGEGVAHVLSSDWHFVPTSSGATRLLPCWRQRGEACPLCELDLRAQDLIGVEDINPKTDKPYKSKKYSLPSARYGLGSATKYLTAVSVLGTDDSGVPTWGPPKVLEMPTTLMKFVWGLPWDEMSCKVSLMSKSDNLYDIFNGPRIRITPLAKPTFFNVDFIVDQRGTRRVDAMFETEAEYDSFVAKIPDLSKLVVFPDDSVYQESIDILTGELYTASGHAAPIDAEVVDASTAMRARKAALTAPGDTVGAASKLIEEDDDFDAPAAPSRRAPTRTVGSADLIDDLGDI